MEQLTFDHDKAYIVLGMHRSGTSFVAGALKEAGVDMGKDLLGANGNNPIGHFENKEFIKLNEDILKHAGGSWDHPPSKETIAKAVEAHRDRIKQLIARSRAKFWGWKDPRNCLTAEYLLPYIEGDRYLVCVFRKPSRVVNSLVTKYQMDRNQAKLLISEYNQRLLETISSFLSE